MELLTSNISPAKFYFSSQKDIWSDCIRKAEKIKIATGYISADSIIELMKIVEINSKPHIDILIGMHYFDKFTIPQYEAVISLSHLLSEKGLGTVYLSNARRYHGKMYSFIDSSSCFSAIIGSSNLSSIIGPSENLYEVDCLFRDNVEAINIDNTISELISKLGTDISKLPPITDFKTDNPLLENHYGVYKTSRSEYALILEKKTSTFFDIPVKTKPKSNLNVFFGKGRINQKNFEMPRPWYEVEIIVPKKITSDDNYPKNRQFKVYTDDGWVFNCFTNGDFGKNFRSSEDLKILGKWIKGRLEQSGALKIGHPVTSEVLNKYGNDKIRLTGTTDPNIWLLDFNGKTLCI